ncbi:peptidase S8 [Erythrobacteraceae bacterium CFH 75059]|nr:peptidase S8 [Erythrobacteraceae bacterium CFH 75059]
MGIRCGVGLRLVLAGTAALALSACGGSGGSRVNPAPPPPTGGPAPAPSPSPSPTPNFDTAEVRRSDGPQFHNAVTAWRSNITGRGQTIAIVDTGIDQTNPEFTGRISAASRDVAGNASVQAENDHGTNVALVAAAALNNTGVVGIAHQATIMALRADRPGTCARRSDGSLEGCQFFDSDIARGVDAAVAAGARVINLSLGGGTPTVTLRNAINRAAQAGVVIVVAAGNGGNATGADANPAEPDPFASGILTAGGANVIITGSVDENGAFSSFSNRAGSRAPSFLSAQGQGICCVYENGDIRVTTEADGRRFVTVFSGTSFAAPQVSGAVALLAQAFPNLTGADIVRILLDSARDAGAAGVDEVYGRGILDIARAFAPRGATSLAGSDTRLALGDSTGVASPAMGDALARGALNSVLTDGYRRAYAIDLSRGMTAAAPAQRLHAAVGQHGRSLGGSEGPLALAVSIGAPGEAHGPSVAPMPLPLALTAQEAAGARVLAATAAARLSRSTTLGLAVEGSADALVRHLDGRAPMPFRMVGESGSDSGFARTDTVAVALRKDVGPWAWTASAASGDAYLGGYRHGWDTLSQRRERRPATTLALALDGTVGLVDLSGSLTWLSERETVLGGYFHPALGVAGANTVFADARLAFAPARGWTLAAATRHGFTGTGSPAGGAGAIRSRALTLDLVRTGVLQTHDMLGLRLSQPLRVTSGGLDLLLPVDYDYAAAAPVLGSRRLPLVPRGRELAGELSWAGTLWHGQAGASLFYRRQPGHVAAAPDDAGLLLSWSRSF